MPEEDLNAPPPPDFGSAFGIWEFCPDQNLESAEEMSHGIDSDRNSEYEADRNPDSARIRPNSLP